MNAKTVFVGLWLTATLTCWAAATPLFAGHTSVVIAVESIGVTVSDMDRSVAFYSDVLAFKPISDVEVDGPEYDQLWGIFGVRARVVRMQLGEQQLELIEFLAPPDVRPIPVPSYSHDLWFQHIAIVVRDMDKAWTQLRKFHVRQISPRPQTIPISTHAALVSRPSNSATRMGTISNCSGFRMAKEIHAGISLAQISFSASTTRP